MNKEFRKSFRQILREEEPCNALRLRTKARQASWLAKIEPQRASELYSIKHAALRQLFRTHKHAPVIRDAWTTGGGYLLSVQLKRTGALLHVPFSQLNTINRQMHGRWIARHARGRCWQRQENFACQQQTMAGAAR